jgi:H+/Cl- antiporter ClcA
VIAALGLVSHGAAHGSGYQYTQDVLAGDQQLPFFYAGIKFLSTWFSYWAGVPGGIFAPSLAIGAGLGNDIALLFHMKEATPLIAVGMVGFLSGVTQAPITAFIIVMEMINGHTMVISLIATALISSIIAKIISPPLYHSIAELQRKRLSENQ